MNNSNFTTYSLSLIGRILICKRNIPHKFEPEHIRDFPPMISKGSVYTFVGFICCSDEQTVILQDSNGDQDCFPYDRVLKYFRFASEPMRKTG